MNLRNSARLDICHGSPCVPLPPAKLPAAGVSADALPAMNNIDDISTQTCNTSTVALRSQRRTHRARCKGGLAGKRRAGFIVDISLMGGLFVADRNAVQIGIF